MIYSTAHSISTEHPWHPWPTHSNTRKTIRWSHMEPTHNTRMVPWTSPTSLPMFHSLRHQNQSRAHRRHCRLPSVEHKSAHRHALQQRDHHSPQSHQSTARPLTPITVPPLWPRTTPHAPTISHHIPHRHQTNEHCTISKGAHKSLTQIAPEPRVP